MRWHKDEVDLWIEQWAAQRRKMVGITKIEPKDRIGKLRSTLAAVREDGEGASQGTITQTFPEVYIGPDPNFPLLVNRAWKEMHREWRPVIEAHYVYVFDEGGDRIKTKQKAAALDLTMALYWKYFTFGKNFVHSFVMCSTKYSNYESVKSVSTQNSLSFP